MRFRRQRGVAGADFRVTHTHFIESIGADKSVARAIWPGRSKGGREVMLADEEAERSVRPDDVRSQGAARGERLVQRRGPGAV
jgi:hypothetical protein